MICFARLRLGRRKRPSTPLRAKCTTICPRHSPPESIGQQQETAQASTHKLTRFLICTTARLILFHRQPAGFKCAAKRASGERDGLPEESKLPNIAHRGVAHNLSREEAEAGTLWGATRHWRPCPRHTTHAPQPQAHACESRTCPRRGDRSPRAAEASKPCATLDAGRKCLVRALPEPALGRGAIHASFPVRRGGERVAGLPDNTHFDNRAKVCDSSAKLRYNDALPHCTYAPGPSRRGKQVLYR